MNERLRKMALEANGPDPYFGTIRGQIIMCGDDAVEQYGKLIIKECCDIINNAVDHREPASTYVAKINSHFEDN